MSTYELFAVRYAWTRPDHPRHAGFIGMTADPHDAPLPLDFFVWVAKGCGRVILIDGGCDAENALKRGHSYTGCPIEALAAIGIQPEDIDTVISTHLHWDHAGNFEKIPNAIFHAVPEEIHYATGPHMCEPFLRRPYEINQICIFLRLLYSDRVVYHDKVAEIAPGILLHPIGGHSPGLCFASVPTQRGRVVLASDAMHFYENLDLRWPFPVLTDVNAYFRGLDEVTRVAETRDHIIPGHDPDVIKLYPAVSTEIKHQIVRLDVNPEKGSQTAEATPAAVS